MIPPRFYRFYQLAAGLCDLTTGILLIFVPELALRLMQIQRLPIEMIFVSFLGAFVGSVGLAYLLFSRPPRNERELAVAKTVWIITGLERFCVGSFVAFACLSKRLEWNWIIVSLVDLSLALFQFWVCRAQSPREAAE